jgi:phosphate transport system protein
MAPRCCSRVVLVVAQHVLGDLRRMGNLAEHIVKIVRKEHFAVPIPGEIRPVFARMSLLATGLAQDAATAIENRDPLSADRLA